MTNPQQAPHNPDRVDLEDLGRSQSNSAGVRRPGILPPVWLLLALIGQFLLDRYLPLVEWSAGGLRWTGAGLIALGLAMTIPAAMSFARAKTGLVPFSGSTQLVTGGWFRISRNPMYLGMAAILGGTAILLGSLVAWLPVLAFVVIIRQQYILPEEKFMESIHGDTFRDYCSRVRRWI